MFARLNQWDKEEKYLLLAIQSNIDDSIARARLGRLYSFQKEWAKADEHFKHSLALKPDDVKTRKWYACM